MTSKEDHDLNGSGIDHDSSGSKSTRASKGKVYLDRLAVLKAKDIKQDVSFNDRGQPIGASGAEMQSYIGVLTRQYIKVSYKNWNDVPADAKNLIWDFVTTTFNVDDQWKKGCMASANSKWRQWKINLYNKFVVPYQSMPDRLYNPPPASGILKEDWKTFAISCISEEFQKDKLSGDEEIDRAMLWKQARANKKEEFEGEHLTQTIIKIALETPEHCGRVRAVGGHITPTVYFNLTREMTVGVGKMQEMSQMMVQMNAKIMELENLIKSKDCEEKGSCSVKNNDLQPIDDEAEIENIKAAQKVKVEGSKGKIKKCMVSHTRDLKEMNVPKTLKLLYSYSRHALHNGSSIEIPLDDDVLGYELTVFIFIEDVYNLCEFEPISVGCICVYLWHLYKTCRDANLLGRIRFTNPYDVSFSLKATTQKWNLMKFALSGQSVFKIMWIDKIIQFDEVGMLK
ncbi:hypothetical protein C2S53_012116 [Perilla frutescens var. hirtella]|uniref:Uncharacterized protein n=1 Tax=Perilla frutescens var. hirtella TaxID=608512 RepID=A0AAD4PBN7_PERFH|nr:hypothetical protein C2S53_012116 [Perilla frutescens var. hirtella]